MNDLELPAPQSFLDTTVEYDYRKEKFDLIALHGFYSHSQASFVGKNETTWLKDLVKTKGWQARIVQYGWSATNLTQEGYIREAITREALKLLAQLKELRKKQETPLPLVFFAHDIGGIIVKEALFLAGQLVDEHGDVWRSTRVLVFFGCPHRSNSLTHMETNIVRFLLLGNKLKGGVLDAKCLAKSIISINDSFLQTRTITRATITSAFSEMDSIKDQIFDLSTTRLRIPSEFYFGIKKAHKALIQETEDEDFHGINSRMMNRAAAFPWREDGIASFINIIESQAAPIYQFKTLGDPTHRFSWLGEDKTFKDWQANRHTHFLHIHGSPSISEAAEYAFELLDKELVGNYYADKILYFKFNRYDIRRNSIGAMANTFLSQILGRLRSSPAGVIEYFEPPDFSECWTDKDAFIFLDKIRICLGNAGQVTWILDSLDQCDESRHWLLSEILGIATRSEQFFKVIITSVNDEYIRNALSEFPEIDLGKHKTGQLADKTRPESNFALLSEVLQDRPQLNFMKSKIQELLDFCKDDDQLRRLLLEWLRSSRFTSKRAVEKEIRFLTPPSPNKLILRILNSVTEERQPWARKLITWVMHAIRPLTPAELAIALVMNEASDESTIRFNASFDIMEEINDGLGPLFVVENGAVYISHPSARDIFSAKNATSNGNHPWYVLHDPSESHRDISDLCLHHLILPDVQDWMVVACKASPNGQPTFEDSSYLMLYAVQFWPQHYRLGYEISSTLKTSEIFYKFLGDKKTFPRWAAANWYFCNPGMRSDKSFLSSLPIIASLGLEKTVTSLINTMSQKERNKAVPFALTEAVRNGHRTVVEMLIKASDISESGYIEAIAVAARSGQFEIFTNLVSHVRSIFKNIELPSMVISRLAFFGLDALLEAQLKAGADADPPGQSDCAPPIYVAAIRNNLSTIDILLKHGANPEVSNANWKNCLPIIAAAKHGHALIVKKLVEAGASVDGKDSENKPSLWWASLLGQYKAVQALVDAKADKSSVELSLTKELDWPVFISTVIVSFLRCNRALLTYGVDPNLPETKNYPRHALGRAAKEGDIEMCRQLIEQGANVDGTDDDKPIIHAVRSGKREIVDLFVKKGANLDAMIDNSMVTSTPLISASELNLLDSVKLLIENNATVDLALSSGVTALYNAARNGLVEVVKVLIAAGGDPKKVAYESKWGVIHVAQDKIECLKVLLDAGADIDSACRDGTALYLATYHNYIEAAKFFISRGARLEITCEPQGLWDDGYNPLLAASELGHTKILRALLEGGANINAKTPSGATPLILAVVNEMENSVKALLEYNVDLEAIDANNNTALYNIQKSTQLSIAKLLINRGANIERRGQENYTFLGRAIVNNIPDIVKYLLEKKANINVIGGFRGGPLHIAAFKGYTEILKLLIQYGGDVNLGDLSLCGTPLQSALYPNNYIKDETTRVAIVRYLIEEANADVNAHAGYFGSALNIACLSNSLDYISLILEKGADPHWADTYGRKPIHYASFKTINHVRLLIDQGVDVTAKTKIGQTALHIAVVTGRVDLVELILAKARHLLNEPDMDGWTPLMWACRLCNKWDTPASIEPEIIKLLVLEGADLWARGKGENHEWSPLKLARYHGASEEVVKLLTPRLKSRIGKAKKEEVWDVKFHSSKRGPPLPGYCDVCLFGIYGTVYACLECVEAFYICSKCASRKKEFHPQHDKWELQGIEFVEEEEEEEEVKDGNTSERETGLVERVQDDDDEGDWSDAEDKEKNDNDEDGGGG